MNENDGASYETEVLETLRAIRDRLDMLAVIDQKLGEQAQAPRRKISLFTLLGLQDLSPRWRVAILTGAALIVTGHADFVIGVIQGLIPSG